MKTTLAVAFLVLPLFSTASLSGTPPKATKMTLEEVLTACQSYGSEVEMIPNGCLNPRTGSMLVCDVYACKKYGPDPRYARLRILLLTEDKTDGKR